MRGFALCLLLLVVVQLPHAQAIYYVDPSGSDGNNGLSPSSAWKTIRKVNLRTFSPGDRILFKRGGTWREQLFVPSSGRAGNPITFDAYDSGDKPIINGADVITAWKRFAALISTLCMHWRQGAFSGMKASARRNLLSNNLDQDYEWYYHSGIDSLYLYSSSDPTMATWQKSVRYSCIEINGQSFVTLKNLRLQYAQDNFRAHAGNGINLSNFVLRVLIVSGGLTTVSYSNEREPGRL